MIWQETPYAIPLLIGAAIAAVSAIFTWRYVYAPGSRWAAVFLLACAEWMAAYAIELAVVDLATKILVAKLSYFGIVAVPTTFFIFALEYTGRQKCLTRRNMLLLSIQPIVTLLLVLTNEAHRLIWTQNVLDTTGSFGVVINSYGSAFWFHTLYSYVLILSVTWLLVQMLVRSRNMYAWQATAMLIACFSPWVGNGLYISRLNPFAPLDLTPLAFTITSLALAWGVSGLRFGDLASVSRRAAIESMSDAVLVLDAYNRIIDLNPAAQVLFGDVNSSKLVGQSVEKVWPEWSDDSRHLSDGVAKIRSEMMLSKGGKKRIYDVGVSPLADWRGYVVSKVVVIRDITERKRLEEELARRYEEAKFLADRDPVTGLLNHRSLHERLDQELKRSARGGHQLSVVMMDLDDFKLFNDTYGHPVGDDVLRSIAKILSENGRDSDIVGRYGGDEFVAILPETGTEGAIEFAERFKSTVEGYPYIGSDGSVVPIRLSFGIASYPEEGRQSKDLVAFADANLYESKQQGGNTITVGDGTAKDNIASLGAFGVFDALVTAVDHKDHYTRKHSEDATDYALMIAGVLGLPGETQRMLRIAGLLHDVGKIGIPDRILRKPGKLDEEEFAVIKQHAILGETIIQELPNLPEVISAIGSHHERIDGCGYPRGLKGEDIPLLGRILAVADAYSAMTTNRPYRRAKSPEEAKAELLRVAGTQLDADLVWAFLDVVDKQIQAAV